MLHLIFSFIIEMIFRMPINDLLDYTLLLKPRVYWIEINFRNPNLIHFMKEPPLKHFKKKIMLGNNILYLSNSSGKHQYIGETPGYIRLISTQSLIEYEAIVLTYTQAPFRFFSEKDIYYSMYTLLRERLSHYNHMVDLDYPNGPINESLLNSRLRHINKLIKEIDTRLETL